MKNQKTRVTESRVTEEKAATIAQAAAWLGVPKPVLRWAKKEGHTAFLSDGRIDMVALRHDLETLKQQYEDRPTNAKEEIENLRAEKLRLEIDELKKKFIDREELAARLGGLCVEVDATLKAKLINEWPASGAGMPADELRRLGTEQHGKIVKRFQEFAAQWT